MMLQYLDTIIAYTVIMLGVSLLITILTQMISALLGCRGTNLLWGLKTLLRTVEPQLTSRKRNDKSKWLAQAGYTLQNWQFLKNDLRNLILSKNASLIEGTS